MKPLNITLLFLLAILIGGHTYNYYRGSVDNMDWSYVEDLKERTNDPVSEEIEEPPVEEYNEMDEAMFNWVTMCESSGNHLDVWGAENEYGLLQYKKESFQFLSDKYNFTGDWKNKDDQIALFLKVSPEDQAKHWSCVRKYNQLTK